MLSELARYRVANAEPRVDDVVLDLAAGDYPPVTRVVLRDRDRRRRLVNWDEIASIDARRRRITLRIETAGRAVDDADLDRLVLGRRDLLDALVLDLANRQATRANDIWLDEIDGELQVRGADVSAWAVFRRLRRGRIGGGAPANLIDWRDVEFLRGDPGAAAAGRDYHRRIGRLLPAEIARLLDALPYLHAAELLTLLPDPAAADTLEAMSADRQRQVFEELELEQGARLIELMAPDAAVDLLSRIGPDLAQRTFGWLAPARAEQLVALLRYPADSVGGIMTNDLVVVPIGLTVGEARDAIADQLSRPDFVYYVYVVESRNTPLLHGVLTLRDLLSAPPDRPVAEVTRSNVLTARPGDSADQAARRVAEHDIAALPVIDARGWVVGAVTADAVIDRLAPAGWREQAPRIFS